MSTLSIHGARHGDRAAGPPRSGRMQLAGPEVGAQARTALRRFSASTRTEGTARDRLGVATVRNQYPATRGLFSDAALMAVLRPPGDRCSWDHYRDLARDRGESPPVPSPELFGLLGPQCRGCRTDFAAQAVAEREEREGAVLAAARLRYRSTVATGVTAAAGRRRPSADSAEPSVREQIDEARRRQREREASYAAAREPGPWYGSRRVGSWY